MSNPIIEEVLPLPFLPPFEISYEFDTKIQETGDGREKRSPRNIEPLIRIKFQPFVLTEAQFGAFNDFFKARKGKFEGFRFQNPLDNLLTLSPESALSARIHTFCVEPNQRLDRFQIVKAYEVNGCYGYKSIYKLQGQPELYLEGMPAADYISSQTPYNDIEYAFDEDRGMLYFHPALPLSQLATSTIQGSYEYPFRFDIDDLKATRIVGDRSRNASLRQTDETPNLYQVENLEIVEIKLAIANEDYPEIPIHFNRQTGTRDSVFPQGQTPLNLNASYPRESIDHEWGLDIEPEQIQGTRSKTTIQQGEPDFEARTSYINPRPIFEFQGTVLDITQIKYLIALFIAVKGRLVAFRYKGHQVRFDSDTLSFVLRSTSVVPTFLFSGQSPQTTPQSFEWNGISLAKVFPYGSEGDELNSLKLNLTCGDPQTPTACTIPSTSKIVTFSGKSGVTYTVTIAVRGIFELQQYSGGVAIPDTDNIYQGGTPQDPTLPIYQLTISSPSAIYYLNHNPSGAINEIKVNDNQFDIQIDGGATVTLELISPTGLLLIPSPSLEFVDNRGLPIGNDRPFNSQWLHVDALAFFTPSPASITAFPTANLQHTLVGGSLWSPNFSIDPSFQSAYDLAFKPPYVDWITYAPPSPDQNRLTGFKWELQYFYDTSIPIQSLACRLNVRGQIVDVLVNGVRTQNGNPAGGLESSEFQIPRLRIPIFTVGRVSIVFHIIAPLAKLPDNSPAPNFMVHDAIWIEWVEERPLEIRHVFYTVLINSRNKTRFVAYQYIGEQLQVNNSASLALISPEINNGIITFRLDLLDRNLNVVFTRTENTRPQILQMFSGSFTYSSLDYAFTFPENNQGGNTSSFEPRDRIYRPLPSLAPTALAKKAGEATDNITIDLLLDDISEAEVRAGVLDESAIAIGFYDLVFIYSTLRPVMGIIRGTVGEISHTDNGIALEFRSLSSYLGQGISNKMSPRCRWKFAGEECGLSQEAFSQTVNVTSVTDRQLFSTDGTFPTPEVFELDAGGFLIFQSGRNTQLRLAIESVNTPSAGDIKLRRPAPYDIVVGDTILLNQNCEKTIARCQFYNNFPRFGGFPTGGNWMRGTQFLASGEFTQQS